MTPAAAPELGWDDWYEEQWSEAGSPGRPLRVTRLDRGWSSVLGGPDGGPGRIRNIGADVAVGDWVVADPEGERVRLVLPRRSAFVRRASFEGSRAEAHTLAANFDVVLLVHALGTPVNGRRLERELVLAFDSGARPVIALSKRDLVDDAELAEAVAAVTEVAVDVDVVPVSGVTHQGLDGVRSQLSGHRTLALLGASGVGKSTLVNALVGEEVQATQAVREGDQRGRHTTVAAELVPLPGGGWLLDTPGLRAVSLWLSGNGIERAFQDVFDLMDDCRFRDCKHDQEPGCAVRAAIEDGRLDPRRFASLERLVAEEAALEAEQKVRERQADRRRAPRTADAAADADDED